MDSGGDNTQVISGQYFYSTGDWISNSYPAFMKEALKMTGSVEAKAVVEEDKYHKITVRRAIANKLRSLDAAGIEFHGSGIVMDINYYLTLVSNDTFIITLQNPGYFPNIPSSRYCSLRGVWGNFDPRDFIYIKEGKVPTPGSIKRSFLNFLKQGPKAISKDGLIREGDYIWILVNLRPAALRRLFKLILDFKVPNRIEWCEYIQQGLIKFDLSAVAKKRLPRKTPNSLFGDLKKGIVEYTTAVNRSPRNELSPLAPEERWPHPSEEDWGSPTPAGLVRAARETSVKYDVVVKMPQRGLPAGNYRKLPTLGTGAFEREDGPVFKYNTLISSYEPYISPKRKRPLSVTERLAQASRTRDIPSPKSWVESAADQLATINATIAGTGVDNLEF